MMTDVKLRVTEALNSSYVSIASLSNYRQALRKALDDDNLTSDVNQKEVEWRKVTDLFDLQSRDVNETNQKIALARLVLLISQQQLLTCFFKTLG